MTDVYVRLKTGYLESMLNLSRNLDPETKWLRDHAVQRGILDGWVLGVYLTEEDAIIHKLTFGTK